MVKVLVLVLAADIPKYNRMTDAMRQTWARTRPYFDVRFYYGLSGNKSLYRTPNNIICKVKEGMYSILSKTILAYDFALKNCNFDYIFRCCASSYVVPKRMMKFLGDKPRKGFYCGAIGKFGTMPFASGSGYFLSRDLVKLIVSNQRQLWKYGHATYMDDVIVGRFLRNNGIIVKNGLRVNLDRLPMKSDINPKVYHYHFPPFPEAMIRIHKFLHMV